LIEQKHNHTNVINNIKIYTLGEFRIVLRNGEIYNTSSKSNRLWSLFKFLLINLNKGITPDILLENVSPEIDYTDPTNAVYNMVYRLRKLLSNESIFGNSKEIILFTNGCYKLNFDEDVWIDFIELEKSFNNAETQKKEDPQRSTEYYLNAFDIYGGELLPELIYESWLFPKRTYYRNLYLKIIANLTKLYADQKLYGAIVEICQKAVSIEPHEEEIQVQLMENLIRVGKIREAKDFYEKTVSILEKEFGIQPTSELQRIAQLLKSEYVQIKTGSKVISQILMNDAMNGAFFCDYRDFYTIYVLEKRKCERSGNALCPVYVEFENEKNVFKSNAYKNSAIKAFKETLVNGLRKGDMVSLINKTRFLILLNNTEYQIVKMVMDRIIDRFHKSAFKDIILEIEVCPSLPKPKSK
jgi:DNA-binding SARP family transcriptional activator